MCDKGALTVVKEKKKKSSRDKGGNRSVVIKGRTGLGGQRQRLRQWSREKQGNETDIGLIT